MEGIEPIMEGIDPIMGSTGAMDAAVAGGIMAGLMVYYFVLLAIVIITYVFQWKVYEKAGQPGWAAIVPYYNLYVLTKIIGRPWWWILLLFVPFVNIVIIVLMDIDLAKSFGKSAGFGLGLLFLSPIFMAILAFGDAQYQGPAAA